MRRATIAAVVVAMGIAGCADDPPAGIASTHVAGAGAAGVGGAGFGGASGSGASGFAGAAGVAGATASGGVGGVDPCASSPDFCSAAQLPPDPMGGAPDGTGFVVQAVDQVYLGDLGWDGTPSPNGDDWQTFGANIDGLHFTTEPQRAFHCQLQPGADVPDEVFDGEGGVDNSFGKNVLLILESFLGTPSARFTSQIQSGQASYALSFAKLGMSTSYSGLAVDWFGARGEDGTGGASGSTLAPTPTQWMDGSYVWHPWTSGLVDASVVDPAAYQSMSRFSSGYLNDDVWVSGDRVDVTLTHALVDESGVLDLVFPLPLHIAQVQMTLAPDHRSGPRGVLSGVIAAQDLEHTAKAVAVGVSTSFCEEGDIASILEEIAACSDIGVDGHQDPTKVCDGISFGIGFTTKPATLGAPVVTPPPGDPCAGP